MNYLMRNVPGTLAMQWLPLHQAIVFQAQRLAILRVPSLLIHMHQALLVGS